MTTVGYVRVSTTEQANSGFSLAAQRTRIGAFALATERVVQRVLVDDGVSAKSLNRPAITALIEEVKAGTIKTVIVVKLDRLTRSVRDLDTLLTLFARHNVDLVSISESLDTASAAGRMVLNIMTSVAQWEREAIGERTEAVLTYKRQERKVYSGHPPFGWKVCKGELKPESEEQRILVSLLHYRRLGYSYVKLAEILNRDRVPTRQNGRKWYPASVRKVLTSRMTLEGIA